MAPPIRLCDRINVFLLRYAKIAHEEEEEETEETEEEEEDEEVLCISQNALPKHCVFPIVLFPTHYVCISQDTLPNIQRG
jgi:hypothetical protein